MKKITINLDSNQLDILRENNDLRHMKIVIDYNNYFSITGTTWMKGYSDFHSGGAIHEDILETLPELSEIVALHLSNSKVDPNEPKSLGEPMHSVENGWYWAGGTKWNGSEPNDPPNADYLASHLRISKEEAENLINKVQNKEMTKEEFTNYANSQKERWETEAKSVIVQIDNIKEIVKNAIQNKQNETSLKM